MAYQLCENIVLTGDLKSDLFNAHNNRLIDILNLYDMKNVITKPTRVTDHSRTLLDPLILSEPLKCLYSDVLKIPQHISDHDASIVSIECPKYTSQSFQREVWIYEKTDFIKFTEKMDQVNWNELLSNLEDVDVMCETFTKTILGIAKECIPTKTVTIRGNDKPWFNGQIRKEIRIRDRLRKKF